MQCNCVNEKYKYEWYLQEYRYDYQSDKYGKVWLIYSKSKILQTKIIIHHHNVLFIIYS